MKNRKRLGVYLLLFALACSGFLFQKQTASAEATSGNYYLGQEAGTPKNLSAVNDIAGIYTPEQIAGFETKMQEMQKDYDCNVVAFIINNEEYNSSKLSAPEQVSEVYLPLDDHKSTVVLWLNVCRGNRSLHVLGYGTAERKIDNDEANNIAYDLQGYVKEQSSYEEGNEYYVKMMDEFIRQTDREMRRPYFYMSWWFHLAVSVVIGLIVVLVLVHNIAGKMTTNGSTYINNAFSQVIGRRDIYTHTTYVRTKKSSSSGGRRSGGGGHSHSSGGGRF